MCAVKKSEHFFATETDLSNPIFHELFSVVLFPALTSQTLPVAQA